MKPIIEITMKQTHNTKTKVTEIKYFNFKMQESFVKIDIVFVTALYNFFNEQVNISCINYFCDYFQMYLFKTSLTFMETISVTQMSF